MRKRVIQLGIIAVTGLGLVMGAAAPASALCPSLSAFGATSVNPAPRSSTVRVNVTCTAGRVRRLQDVWGFSGPIILGGPFVSLVGQESTTPERLLSESFRSASNQFVN